MRRGKLILLLALALGVCMFFCARMFQQLRTASDVPLRENHTMLPELEWLRKRLQLDEGQFTKVRELHLAYLPKCHELCQRIQNADENLMQVLNDPRKDAAAALQARAAVQVECQQAVLAHIRQTADCMNAGQAREYFDIVLPHFLGVRGGSDSGPAQQN